MELIDKQEAIEAIKRAIWNKQIAKDAIDAVCNISSAQSEQAIKDCRNCKHGSYNDHWDTYFCYCPNDCNDWNKWEPSAQPENNLDEWCTDCKEYDQERHCCPRFNRVIRETAEEVRQNAQPERMKGKWAVREGELAFWDVCDQCGKKILHRTPFYNFCPHCGADMRGEEDE